MPYCVYNPDLKYTQSCESCNFELHCAIADSLGGLGPKSVLESLLEQNSSILKDEQLDRIKKLRVKIEESEVDDPTNETCVVLQKAFKIIKSLRRKRDIINSLFFEE